MEAVKYTINFENHLTQNGYYFVTYQNQMAPSQSIDWMTVGIPYMQSEPSKGKIIWSMEYEVTVVEEQAYTDLYHLGSVTYPAKLGMIYKVNLVNGLPQFVESGPSGLPENIEISNNTDEELNLGVALGGNLLATQSVYGGVLASFDMSSTTYKVGVTSLKPTEATVFTDESSVLTPVSVQFPDGLNAALVSLEVIDGQQAFAPVEYSYEDIEATDAILIIPSSDEIDVYILKAKL